MINKMHIDQLLAYTVKSIAQFDMSRGVNKDYIMQKIKEQYGEKVAKQVEVEMLH